MNLLYGPAFTCNDKLVGAHVDLATSTSSVLFGAASGEFCVVTAATVRVFPRRATPRATARTYAYDGGRRLRRPGRRSFGIDRGPTSRHRPRRARDRVPGLPGKQGCFQSDSVAAVGQAISDGANVLNFSISGGKNPYTDAVEADVPRSSYACGRSSANASAGNAGPGAAHGGPRRPVGRTRWARRTRRAYTSPRCTSSRRAYARHGGLHSGLVDHAAHPRSLKSVVMAASSSPAMQRNSTCRLIAFAGGFVSNQIVALRPGQPRWSSGFQLQRALPGWGGWHGPPTTLTHQDLFTDNFSGSPP